MKSLYVIPFVLTIFCYTGTNYTGGSTAAVTLAGGIIKAKSVDLDVSKKYRRKDCPICKGAGWYLSGDKIKKIDCTYCIPDTKQHEQKNCTTIIKKG